MDPDIPPPIQKTIRKRGRVKRLVVVWLCLFGICMFIIELIHFFSGAASIFSFLRESFQVSFTSYTDTFHVQVLEVKAEPNHFRERVRIQCEGDMHASIYVTDLKKFRMEEIPTENGQTVYREGQPHVIGGSAPVQATGKFSTCEIVFKIDATSGKTAWHSEIETSSGKIAGTLKELVALSIRHLIVH